MRKWFYVLNFGLLGAFLWAYALDYTPEWKGYQKKYYKMAAEGYEKDAQGEKDPAKAKILMAQAKSMRSSGLDIKQIIVKDLGGRADRCITCHVGMDEYTNPSMTNGFMENPYKAHPDLELLRKHPFQKFGCTVCHEGQGLATTSKDGHGRIHNWEDPLLEGKRIQGSCVRCHGDFETLKGAETAAKGKKLFNAHGCQGCHSIKGVGGIVSVDLGEIADKPLERIAGYNFSRVMKDGKPLDRHDWTLQNWVWGHLSNDPIWVTPNDPYAKFNKEPIAPSGMPDFRKELGPDGAEAITAYLMSMTAEHVPSNYYVQGDKASDQSLADPLKNGKRVFEKHGCAGCHGLLGAEGRRNFNALGPGQGKPEKDMEAADIDKLAESEMGMGREPTLTEVVGTYTHEELKHKIQEGVKGSAIVKFNPDGPTPPLYMPPWKDKIKGKDLDDLATWLLSTAKKDESGF